MGINKNITGSKPLKDFKHMISPIDKGLNSIKTKGFYFICGDYLKENVYRDQIYFYSELGELFYYSCFNEWNRSNNKQSSFVNLLKLV